ncbi:MAG TPA: MerR family transcriptional regulator [Microthrixaceae bacterium]|nr:MerR family transcriptional regulator [Microthrixaceae bacterium]
MATRPSASRHSSSSRSSSKSIPAKPAGRAEPAESAEKSRSAGETGDSVATEAAGQVIETPDSPTEAESALVMTLEELAEATGVAPRTIRYYQTKKLLQPPTKDGKDARLARYGTDHVERLRLIGELHDRGLKLPAIRDLLESGDASTRVADWLGLDDSLRGSWDPDLARIFDSGELTKLLDSTPTGTRGLLEDSGLIVRQGNSWLVPNPTLLDLTIGLVKDGIRPDLVVEAGAILQSNLRKAADELIELFVKALSEGFGNGADSASLVHALRPVAGDAARMIFGQQLELSIEELLADTKRISRR